MSPSFRRLRGISLYVILSFLAFWLLGGLVLSEIRKVPLIINPSIATGTLVDQFAIESENDRGRVYEGERGVYRFQVKGGDYLTSTDVGEGDLKPSVTVEYWARSPSVARVQGDGPHSVLAVAIFVGFLLVVLVGFLYEMYKAAFPKPVTSIFDLMFPPGSEERAELERRSNQNE